MGRKSLASALTLQEKNDPAPSGCYRSLPHHRFRV
jgi:hypothetical protein